MADLKVAASTFPYLYSHSGLDALKHLAGMGFKAFEMMIFPPHCWPAEMSAADRAATRSWLDGEGLQLTSFCYPLLDNNPNGVDRMMRDYTLARYREAIDLALDRERIARLLFGDLGRTWCLPYDTNSIAYVAEEDDCEYDLDKARSVLDSAGLDLPLEIRMQTSTELRTEYTTIAEILQADLKEIGINLTIDNVDAVTYRNRFVNEQNFELASHAYGRAGKDPSSLLETTVVFKPEGNVSGFEDPAYTEAVTRGGSTPDEAERRAAYAQASKILRDSHHVLSIVPRPRLYVASAAVEGLAFSADGYAIFENVTKE